MTTPFDIYPSIDIVSGFAMVSQAAIKMMLENSYDQSHVSKMILGTPTEVINKWQNEGAKKVHIVDLNAAAGTGDNYQAVKQAISMSHVRAQVCGGIRDDRTLERALNLGCERVNIGTAVLENIKWCEKVIKEHGNKIAIALDVKQINGDYYLTSRGWRVNGGLLWPVLDKLNKLGCLRYVVTDVEKGGMLSKPNFDLLKKVCTKTDSPIIAGGGVSSLNDIITLSDMRELGIEGVILGQALHIGIINIPSILSIV
ncbi:HisA/HisF-related TIM barrel protein [Providencia manganoxydans]|uniref:HisA/HisF-related TIM barrel protein n=1 Tax=Providencia manganoxydans TaxID=2923283 RepID=UPI0029C07160|nr:HisA/HisF-related TIM barrel protein [Providencia manganoxydans]MDX4944739.1 HisA/HisF-related TIM barrel protein [Providencia manganoxydans]